MPRTASNCALSRLGRGENGDNQRLLEGKPGSAAKMVPIQITPQSAPSPPSWLGEVAAFAQVLTHTGLLKTIQDEVRFARARFGRYESFRFCCSADWLHPFRRADEAFLLQTACSLCLAVHGLGCREISCLIAPPCPDFWRLSTSPRWRRFARSFDIRFASSQAIPFSRRFV